MSEQDTPKPEERIDTIRLRLADATPGPWLAANEYGCLTSPDGTHVVCMGDDYDQGGSIGARYSLMRHIGPAPHDYDSSAFNVERKANRELIEHATEDIAFLLQALDALRAERDRLKGAAKDYRAVVERFQHGTQPKSKRKQELFKVAVAQGTLAVLLKEFDDRFAALTPTQEPTP